jgi:hypothetical protein
MTFAERFTGSRRAAVFVASLSFCFWASPKALRAWERSLVSAGIRACEAEGGTALTAADHVVSCAPKTRAKESP